MSNQLMFLACSLMFSSISFAHPGQKSEQDKDPLHSIFSEINHSDIVEVSLTTDLNLLLANIKGDDYQPAEFTFQNKEGEVITNQVEIRPRGRFRRRACGFPPFKMKFSKRALVDNGYNQFNAIKFVSHCLENELDGEENVLKEYLAYKIFNLISTNSYRVQLVRINYIDSKNPENQLERYAFMIEGTKEMSDRLGGTECECMNQAPQMISSKDENLVAVFQYFIGNADWNTPLLRNIKLVQPSNGNPMIPVPYDFDFAGIVDAPYAIPNPDLGLTSVQDRAYLGWSVAPERLQVTLKLFEVKKTAIKALIDNFELLNKKTRHEMLNYVDSFYSQIDEVILANRTGQ